MQSDSEDPALIKFKPKFLQSRIKEITDSLLDPNLKNVRELAHNWKGFSRPYGFIELERIAERLSREAKAENTQACVDLLKKAKNYCLEQQKALNV